ncbi:MAG: hypothetical protein R2794_11100 [Chitinophagales bacterium]
MKKKLLKITGLLFLLLCVAAVFYLTKRNAEMQDEQICSDVVVNIDKGNGVGFLVSTDITDLLWKTFGDSVRGDKIKTIPVSRIEKVVAHDPYVASTQSYLDANGKLHIDIVQKEPIARVINKYGVHYYINENANKIPVSSKFTSRVPVVTGDIDEGTRNTDMIETPVLQNALELVRFMHAHPFWNAQIEQISVTADGNFLLVPKLGDHIIEFGKAENIEEKFHKLEIFYNKGLSYTGWDNYSTINLDYENLVVADKKENYGQ